LIVIAIGDYDLILGIDWLSRHRARVDCRDKRVQFVRPGRNILEYYTNQVKEHKFLIVGAKARKMIAKGCQGYLAYLLDKSKDQCTLEDTAVVKEYQDVFPVELTSLSPSREVKFTSDLVLGVAPVSRTLYLMAPAELKDLKE
jgi:hypothetical protein